MDVVIAIFSDNFFVAKAWMEKCYPGHGLSSIA